MNYLYGDSTPSQLTSNFLEFLGDAIDFAVAVLHADEQIKLGQERARELSAAADAETQKLDAFIQIVADAIEREDKGAADSPTGRAGSRLLELVFDTHRATLKSLRQRLADDLARIDGEEADARERCVRALEALLLPHDPPDASAVLTIALAESGRYAATLSAHAAFGLDWSIDLAIPEANLWSAPVQVARVLPHLQIHAPQLSGWISKEVKVKPQKLERQLVTELVDDGRIVRLKLRQEPAATAGYDLSCDLESTAVQATRVGPAEDASSGEFTPAEEDIAPLVELVSKLRAAGGELPRHALSSASSAGSEFRAQPTFVDFVQRLIAMMTPIVLELSRRSLTPNELILRRPLSDHRREEMFVSKATLTDKYAGLAAPLRALFAPLKLDQANAEAPAPSRAAPSVEQPTLRVELPSSRPPPPPPPSRPAPSVPPPAAIPSATPAASMPPPSMPPPSMPPPSMPPPLPSTPPPLPATPPTPPSKGPPSASPLSRPPPAPARANRPRSLTPPPLSRAPVARAATTTAPWAARPRQGAATPAPPPAGATPPLPPLPPARTPPRKKGAPSAAPPPAPPSETASIEVTSVEDVLLSDLPQDTASEGEKESAEKGSEGGETEQPSSGEGDDAGASEDAPPSPLRPSSFPAAGQSNEELVTTLKRIVAMARGGRSDEAHVEYAQLFSDMNFGLFRPEEQRQALRLMVIPKTKPTPSEPVLEAHRVALPRIEKLLEAPQKDAGDYELLGVTQIALGDLDAARAAFATALAIERARNAQSELVGTLMKRMSEI